MSARRPVQLGPFRLSALLERGGMGEVWLAEHTRDECPVAVKIMASSRSRSQHALKAFRQEARAIASLDHAHIARVYDYGRVSQDAAACSDGALLEGSPYLAMEYAAGGALNRLNHSISWPQIRDILSTILKALAHAHARGVIHRDLKPGNILLRQGIGAPTDLLLSDFGLAHALHPHGEESTEDAARGKDGKTIIGTPGFMAPEQIAGKLRDQGPWTDLYSLGCLTWQLLHGAPPFGLDPTDEVLSGHLSGIFPRWAPNVSVPDGLRDWLRTLLAKNPHDRFPFAAQAASELYRLDSLSGVSIDMSRWDEPREHAPKQLVGAGLGLYELRPVPLVGRQRERDTLWRAFCEVQASKRSQIVVIEGPAGVGKSRLAQWLSYRVHAAGLARTLRANHEHAPHTDDALGVMLAQALRCVGLTFDETRARVLGFLKRWRAFDESPDLLAQDALTLTHIMHPQKTPLPPGGNGMRIAEWRERLLASKRLLARIGRNLPIVLWVDDAQWASEVLSLITEIHHGQEPLPILFVLTCREEVEVTSNGLEETTDALPHFDGQLTIELPQLDPLAVTALLRRLLPLEPNLAREVERRAQGNPLFTIQLVGDWVQRDALTPGEDGWCLKEGVHTPLPENIHQLWSMRVEQLLATFGADASHAREALEIAATLGREVIPTEWIAICQEAGFAIPDGLVEAMIKHRMAIVNDTGWSFYHEMLRESVLEDAKHRGRDKAHHACCAKSLERRYEQGESHLTERLTRHLIDAGLFERALAPLLQAIAQARIQGDFSRARGHHNEWRGAIEALALPEHDPRYFAGHMRRARVEIAAGEFQEAERALEEAHHHAVASGREASLGEIYLLRARIARKRGALSQTERELERSLELFERAAPRSIEHGRALMAYGDLQVSRGDHIDARRVLLRAVDIFRAGATSGDELGRALLVLSDISFARGEHDRAHRLIDEAIVQFEKQSNRIALSHCYNMLGEASRRRGAYDEATHQYRRALTILQAMGSREAIFPHLNFLFTMIEKGDYQAAEAQLPPLELQLREQERWAYVACLLLGMARCDLASGRAARCDARMEEAAERLREEGAVEEDAAIFAEAIAEAALRGGDLERAQCALQIAASQRRGLNHKEKFEELTATLEELAASR